MNFTFFGSLTSQEAQTYLSRYLEVESDATNGMISLARDEGIIFNYSLVSISLFLKWILGKLKFIPSNADETVPNWIRESTSYKQGLFDFDEPSKPLVMRASYYLGESFIRDRRTLSWGVGRADTAEHNMPIVAGFRNNLQMAPIMVTENLFRRVVLRGASDSDIDCAIDYWQKAI